MNKISSTKISTPKTLNPLWIISIFLSLTEISLAYAVFNTSGTIQTIVLSFALVFPILVAIIFFIFLWFKPQNLYAPKDFQTDEAFIEVMKEQRESQKEIRKNDLDRIEDDFENMLKINIESFKEKSYENLDEKGKKLIDTIINSMNDTLLSQFKKSSFFKVDLSLITNKDNDILSYPSITFINFQSLLDELFYFLEPYFPPYSYGSKWVLRDKKSGQKIENIRMIKKLQPGTSLRDSRSLNEAGVYPNIELEVIKC